MCTINPLSPNSDQHQFSPNNIHTLSRNKVMRINEIITEEKMPRLFIKVSQLILKGNVWRSVWRICKWMLGLNPLSPKSDQHKISPCKYQCFVKQRGHENYGLDHTR